MFAIFLLLFLICLFNIRTDDAKCKAFLYALRSVFIFYNIINILTIVKN